MSMWAVLAAARDAVAGLRNGALDGVDVCGSDALGSVVAVGLLLEQERGCITRSR
jgi:hypothetical protein